MQKKHLHVKDYEPIVFGNDKKSKIKGNKVNAMYSKPPSPVCQLESYKVDEDQDEHFDDPPER